MEEFFLGALLFAAAEELDVVDEEDVDVAVPAAEAFRILVLDALDEFIDEVFAGNAQEAHIGKVF